MKVVGKSACCTQAMCSVCSAKVDPPFQNVVYGPVLAILKDIHTEANHSPPSDIFLDQMPLP